MEYLEYMVFGDIEEDDLFLEDVSRLQEVGASLFSSIALSLLRLTNAQTLRLEEQRLTLMRFRLKMTRMLKIYIDEHEGVLEEYNVKSYYVNKAKDEVIMITRETIMAFEKKWKGVRNAPQMTWELLDDMMTGDQRNLMFTYGRLLEEKRHLEKRKSDAHNLVCQYKSLLSKNRDKLEEIRKALLLQSGTAMLDDMVSEHVAEVSDVVVDVVQSYNDKYAEIQRRDEEEKHVLKTQGKARLSGAEEYKKMTAAIWDNLIQEANLEIEAAKETVTPQEREEADDTRVGGDGLRQRRSVPELA